MAQLLTTVTSRVTSIYNILPTDAELREGFTQHIAEISKDYRPIQGEEPNFEQKDWFESRISKPFPKPYRPWDSTKKEFEFKTFSFAEILASVEPLEETE